MRNPYLALLVGLMGACNPSPVFPGAEELGVWEPVWFVLPDGTEVQTEGRRVPWARPGFVEIQGDVLVPKAAEGDALKPLGLVVEPFTWGQLWPQGVVPYDDSLVSEAQRERIQQAIAHIREKTPIRFVRRTDEPDYVRFMSDGRPESCWSYLGRVGGAQDLDVYCGQDGVPPVGVVVHELLHALGLLHEHSRADRDLYVDILWENILDDYRSQFVKIGGRGKLHGEYDYDSVMHYHAKAFSKNGDYTILPKNGVSPDRIGQRGGLSPGDVEAVRGYYATPLLRLRWWFHQTTFSTAYSFPQELRNVGAVPAQLEAVDLEGKWLGGAQGQGGTIPPGGSVPITFQAKPCGGVGLEAERVRFRLQGGETYEVTYTRACYRHDQLTLLRLEPAGSESLSLTFAEWTWAKSYTLEGRAGGSPIALPVRELKSSRALPVYTALLTLPGLGGQEVCLRITPLDSTAQNPTPAEACALVPR
ncbi:MAG: M12 family metallopeptidase [Thermus sp.]|uniref:M12 family metallopeptidase n=1 Tax=Thermus sp. TaxID=275 RepID=UPI00391BD822